MATAEQNVMDVWRELVARAWKDEQFKQDLTERTNEILADHGINTPAGVNWVIVENEPTRLHLVLPASPEATAAAISVDDQAISDYNAAICF